MGFGTEIVVLSVNTSDLDVGNVRPVATILDSLSSKPIAARAKRSCFVISFESSGVLHLAKDARSIAFMKKLEATASYVGYFLNADAPFYHLRKAIMAIASSAPGALTVESFLAVHDRLYQAAVEHCAFVGDSHEPLEEQFEVNLPPDILRTDRDLQRRAMRHLHPTLVLSATASPALLKRAFTEAEQVWGRVVADFDSREHFLHEFEKAFQ